MLEKNGLLYYDINDNYIKLFDFYYSKESTKLYEIKDIANINIKLSRDGKYLYYIKKDINNYYFIVKRNFSIFNLGKEEFLTNVIFIKSKNYYSDNFYLDIY